MTASTKQYTVYIRGEKQERHIIYTDKNHCTWIKYNGIVTQVYNVSKDEYVLRK